jgi:CRP-like cAMP-binding protein
MAMDALVKPLLRLPLFQGLKPLQLTEIVRRAHRIVYRAGDLIIEEDKTGDAAIVIVSGEAVRIDASQSNAPGEPVPEGAIVGELAMLVETVHSATVVARGPVRALKITREDMHAQMAEDPRLAEHMMDRIAARLNRLASELRAIDEALSGMARFEPHHAGTSRSPEPVAALH